MNNLKAISFILLIGLVLGGFAGYNLHTCPVIVPVSVVENTTVTSKKDSVITPVNVTAPEAKPVIKYVPIKVNDKEKQKLINSLQKQIAELTQKLEKVAQWDTTSANGFEAHIKYFTSQEKFDNNFVYPHKLIVDSIFVTNIKTITNTVTNFIIPNWELGGGIKAAYLNSEFKFTPFAELTRNFNLKLAVLSFDMRAFFTAKNGSLNMQPEAFAKLKFRL